MDVKVSEAQDISPLEFLDQSQIFCQLKKYQKGLIQRVFVRLHMRYKRNLYIVNLCNYYNLQPNLVA